MTGGIDPYHQREFCCEHCNGRIVIPIELPPTTGPCPHCGGVITSPPPPAGLAVAAPVPQAIQQPAAQVQPVVPPTAVPQAAPAPAPVVAAADPTPAAAPQRGPVSVPAPAAARRSGLVPALLVLLVLILALGAAFIYLLNTNFFGASVSLGDVKVANPARQTAEEEYLRNGWQRDALKTLRGYLEADSAEAKAQFTVEGRGAEPKLAEFYGGSVIDDSDTPVEAFAVQDLSMEDRRRGLFWMVYDQPPQFAMRDFFRPLASLEVQYGLENADILLSSVAQASNFAMEPVRVHAFFKKDGDALKLDWDIFAQTKYRTFRNFVDVANPGQRAVFRVFVTEEIPDHGKSVPGFRTYRFSDPATTTDNVRIQVKVDSEAGKALSAINWRDVKSSAAVPGKPLQPISRTATVELEWTAGDEPQLVVHRFICWEFLGLGGKEAPASASK